MKKDRYKKVFTVIIINLCVFILVNIVFNIKYEQVDDFIIYSLYSGLDGTNNFNAIYMHPAISTILGMFYRTIPLINWHTIFLLSMQFVCFTIIGYTIIKKYYTEISIILYAIFVSIFYTTLLMLIQYTSVAALLIITTFFLIIDIIETNYSKLKLFTVFTIYTIGIMTRIQSLLIVIPFFMLYFAIYLIRYKNKIIKKEKIIELTRYYLIILLITILVYISNVLICNLNPINKEYNEWNEARTTMQDIVYIDYDQDKEIYDQVGWSENDLYLFRTFGFGDENIFSKSNLQKILSLKNNKGGEYGFITNVFTILETMFIILIQNCAYIFIIFLTVYILNVLIKNKIAENTLIFILPILINIIFTIINRNVLRVVIPGYILATALLIYNLNLKTENKIYNKKIIYIIITIIIVLTCICSGQKYEYNYKLNDYENYRDLIKYTNSNKGNVYLYTIPSLQHRYLAYNVYQMPPVQSFSNLRQIGRMGYVYTELF